MMGRGILFLFGTWLTASTALAQHGYLGERNMLSIGANDRLWSNAWSLSYFRTVSKLGAVRFDLRLFSADKDLREGRNGFIAPGRVIGILTGSGTGFGVHYYQHAGAGLSAPLGYFAGFGLEYSATHTRERYAEPQYYERYPVALDTVVTTMGYRHSVFRIVYTWGVRKVIAGNVVVDLGGEFSYVFDKATADRVGPAPVYNFPMEACAIDGTLKEKAKQEFHGRTVTVQPMLRIGYMF